LGQFIGTEAVGIILTKKAAQKPFVVLQPVITPFPVKPSSIPPNYIGPVYPGLTLSNSSSTPEKSSGENSTPPPTSTTTPAKPPTVEHPPDEHQ
jgi:hypothetical protein